MMPKQLPFYRFSTTNKKNLTFSQYLKWCKENNLVADEAFQANSVFKNSLWQITNQQKKEYKLPKEIV